MPVETAITLGSILAVIATVAAFIFIVPDKKRSDQNKFLQWVHDVLNFKILYIEYILKALYILETAFCICAGFFMLFSVIDGFFFTVYIGWAGLLVMIIGPIITRLIYELLMLAVLHLKATREINDKLVVQPGSVAEQKEKDRIKAEQEAAERARLAQQQQQIAQQQFVQQQPFAQQQYQQQYGQQPYRPQQYQQPMQPMQQPQQYQQPMQPIQPIQQPQPQVQDQPQPVPEQPQVQEQTQTQAQEQTQQNNQNQ